MKKDKNEIKGDFVGVSNTTQQKEVKKTKKKNDKPNFFKRIGMKTKDVFSELKKVSWPTFSKVVKKTGIVLVVVLIFLIVITAFDYGLLQLLQLVAPRG